MQRVRIPLTWLLNLRPLFWCLCPASEGWRVAYKVSQGDKYSLDRQLKACRCHFTICYSPGHWSVSFTLILSFSDCVSGDAAFHSKSEVGILQLKCTTFKVKCKQNAWHKETVTSCITTLVTYFDISLHRKQVYGVTAWKLLLWTGSATKDIGPSVCNI